MGARQSRRSVDITTTPKKEGLPADGGDAAAPGDGKLERIEESDTKPTTNGIAPHTDTAEDKDKDKDDATEKDKDKDKEQEEVKAEETKVQETAAAETPAETAEVTTPTETNAASPNTATSPDSKETKKKEKMKKKWSFRSISFSKKDKNKPAREEAPKNGDVTKEEPLAEGGEEAENGSGTAGSPVEDKSAESSPTAEIESVAAGGPTSSTTIETAKEESSTGATVSAMVGSQGEEKTTEERSVSSSTSVPPVEETKEEVEKLEAEKKVVEVSQAGGQFVPDPIEVSVFRVQTTVATPSIVERKTSEDVPSLPPSSPPPTPIDSSPFQQARQAGIVRANDVAKALNLPTEVVEMEKEPMGTSSSFSSSPSPLSNPSNPQISSSVCLERNDPLEGLVQSSVNELSSSSYSDPVHESPREQISIPSSSSIDPSTQITRDLETFSAGDGSVGDKIITEDLDPSPYDVRFKPDDSPSRSRRENAANGEGETASNLEMQEEIGGDFGEVPRVESSPETIAMEGSSKQELERGKVPIDDSNLNQEKQELIEQVAEVNEVAPEEVQSVEEEVEEIELPTIPADMIVDSEEGPIPLSDETLVEAKLAVVISEDEDLSETREEAMEEEEIVEEDAIKVENEYVEVIPGKKDKLETEIEPDVAITVEQIVIAELPMDSEDSPKEESSSIVDSTDKLVEEEEAVLHLPQNESTKVEEESQRFSESPEPGSQKKFRSETDENGTVTVPFPIVSNQDPQNLSNAFETDGTPISLPGPHADCPIDSSNVDLPEPPVNDSPLQTSEISSSSLNADHPLPISNESSLPSCNPEQVPDPTTDRFPASISENIVESSHNYLQNYDQRVESTDDPLPIDELSSRFENRSDAKNDLPIPDENHPSGPNNGTETLLTPPRSPSPNSNVSITSSAMTTISTKDSSQTQLCYDDQSNREFKMESVSISLNSYNESDIELKERLAESLAETEEQEGSSVSCQLSNNNATSSTTVQEMIHQSTPETEAPVENNVAHDSTTESSDETSKVTPPAVLCEVPASPPSAPAITEDVASVAKAIGDMDISDKSIAAATIECNTNEIIADADYQMNMNE